MCLKEQSRYTFFRLPQVSWLIMKRDGYTKHPVNLVKTVLMVWMLTLYSADNTAAVITPPKIVYGGWKPILPGHPFYFGARDNNVPIVAGTNTHQYVHEGPIQYIEQVIHPTKYALLPENVLQNSKHGGKDIFSYYPRSPYGSDVPAQQEIGYKPIYIELPRKPLEIFENPTLQTPPSLQHHIPQQHAMLQIQNTKHPQGNRLFGQTFIKITPLVGANGQRINTENIEIRPYFVPLPRNPQMQLVHQNSIPFSMDKLHHHTQQQHQPGGDRPYLREMQYIEQNEISASPNPLRYQKQVIEVPQHVLEQPVYQDAIQNAYAARSLKQNLKNNYLSMHQNLRIPKRNLPNTHVHFPDPVKHQYPNFANEPFIYQMEDHDNNYKTDHQPIIQYHNQNRFPATDLLFSSQYQYKINEDQELRHPKFFLDDHTEKYNSLQNLNDMKELRIHHKQRMPPRILYKEIETPKPPIYHFQSTPRYANKDLNFKKQMPEIAEGDLAIIHIPLREYLRLKAHEGLLKKETLFVTSHSKRNVVHQPNDYQTQHSNKNSQYKESEGQSNQINSYSNPHIQLQLSAMYNATKDDTQTANTDAEIQKDQQVFHAYYAPADHEPPEGYVRMTVKEFDQMFKNAEIRYVDKQSETLNDTSNDTNAAK